MSINLKMPGGKYYFSPAKKTSEEIMTAVAKDAEEAITDMTEEEDAFAHVDNTPAPAPAKKSKVTKQVAPDPAPEAEEPEPEEDISLDIVLDNIKADSDNLAADYAMLKKLLGNGTGDSKRVKELEEENRKLKAQCAKMKKMVDAVMAAE